MKVLLVLDHAPDYRESFLRQLGAVVRLTVVAQPCDPDGLTPPAERRGYEYIELPSSRILGFIWQSGLTKILTGSSWDIVCVGLNLRHLARLVSFLRFRSLWSRWIWWGHIFGRTQSSLLDRIRGILLTRAAACLTYNEPIAQLVKTRYGVQTLSFNNSEVLAEEFRPGHYGDHAELRFLFVGRFQERKKLHRLVELAERWPDIRVRIIGPGMERLRVPQELLSEGRVQLFGRLRGSELNAHFDWADLVVNPGHVGLLVMNAARHGKGIAIDADTQHAPEYWLAREAAQPFIPFGDPAVVEQFLEKLREEPACFRKWGQALQQVARQRYTIEYMVKTHLEMFRRVAR